MYTHIGYANKKCLLKSICMYTDRTTTTERQSHQQQFSLINKYDNFLRDIIYRFCLKNQKDINS